MNTTCNFYHWAPMVVIMALTACAEGGSSGTGLTAPAGSHTTQGSITGFGSVFVNGVEYDSKASTITLEGVAQSEDKLAVGMVVKVNGSVNSDGKTGVAKTIEYADELEGIVLLPPDLTAKTVNVMGQTVHVTAETLFAGAPGLSLTGIVKDNVIEVSGYSSGHGDIYATRIELKSAVFTGEEVELKGVVANLDTSAKTFNIGTLTIDYRGASGASSGLSNDQYVEVKSTSVPANNVLLANNIEVKDSGRKGLMGEDGDTLELEGIVTNVSLPTTFELNGQIILLNDQTQYENGMIANIVADTKLEVAGQFDASGNVIAKTVKFREIGATRLRAYVSATDPTLNAVVVLGLIVKIDNLTVLIDKRESNSAVPVRYFGVKYLVVGDYVELQIYKNGSGGLVATQLIRNDVELPGVVNLNGLVESVAIAGQLTVAGVTVQIPSGDSTVYKTGDKIDITGTYANNTLTASAIVMDD